jgi:hypothetical protein
MGPEKTMVPWGVGILKSIGTTVMMAMGGSPPKGAKLGRTGSQERQEELKSAAGFEGPMGKITVISGCYPKHPHDVGQKADQNRIKTYPCPENPKTDQMHQRVGDRGKDHS